jgi:hypothetical protein
VTALTAIYPEPPQKVGVGSILYHPPGGRLYIVAEGRDGYLGLVDLETGVAIQNRSVRPKNKHALERDEVESLIDTIIGEWTLLTDPDEIVKKWRDSLVPF